MTKQTRSHFGKEYLEIDFISSIRKEIFNEYKLKKLPPKTIRNNLSLLNQIIKYYQNLGIIDRKCVFQVRRLTDKNKFYMNRIIIEKELY